MLAVGYRLHPGMGYVDISKQSSFHQLRANLQRKCKCELVATSSCSSWRWVHWPRKGGLISEFLFC